MEAIEKEKEVENEEEEEEIDTGPIVPNKEFLNSNKLYNVFYYILIPIICLLIIIGCSYTSIKLSTPMYLFFGLLLIWLLIVYPIYY